MGIWEAVVKGFSKANGLLKIIGIFFIFNAIVSLISVPLTDPARAAEPAVIAVSIVSSIFFFLVFIFLQGGALGVVSGQIKTGAVDIAKFLEYGKKFYLRILGLLLMYVILAIAVVLILGLISAGILLLGDNTFTRVIVALIVTVASLGIITLLIYPIYALITDDLGPLPALRKGIAVSMGNFLKTLGLFVMLLLVSLIISFIVGALVGAITIPFGPKIGQYVVALANAVVQSYIPVVMMISFMSMYLSVSSQGTSKA